MSDIICVTSIKLCSEDFFVRLKKIAASGVRMVILREHELPDDEYSTVYSKAEEICVEQGVLLVPHSRLFIKSDCIHVKLDALRSGWQELKKYRITGTSVHSPEEASLAQKLGASYVIAGHIFPTDCKKDLPPRGLEYLKNVCQAVNIPVYGIGGITPDNFPDVLKAGASGACVMSSLMTCEDPTVYVEKYHSGK